MSSQHQGASLGDYLKALPQYLLPHHALSRVIYFFTRLKTPLKNPVGRWFIKTFKVDMSEAQEANIEAYASFNEFFTRELKTGLRPIDPTEHGLTSPVDGTVSQAMPIENGSVFQAKGRDYTLLELLGGDADLTARFDGGIFSTLYLSPRDYHRIHMPQEGTLKQMIYIPGRLFSVAAHTVRVVPRLFARNERVVALFETEHGPLAMVLVGAMNVSAIDTVWQQKITPSKGKGVRRWDYSDEQAITLKQGEEMGRFNMGSTVILVASAGAQWSEHLQAGEPVRMGELIGQRAISSK
ncbi:MAG: archaetidylserine decarboxylase [Gammaproteobacteria bacterium]|nr:archaetidylserine decarboxylase [Gammaproteobacteria bacterium]